MIQHHSVERLTEGSRRAERSRSFSSYSPGCLGIVEEAHTPSVGSGDRSLAGPVAAASASEGEQGRRSPVAVELVGSGFFGRHLPSSSAAVFASVLMLQQ